MSDIDSDTIEERVSGFRVEGEWQDIVELGERITAALQNTERKYSKEAFDEWREWHPKIHERLGHDIREKTAEQVHLEEGPGEQANQRPSDDLQKAGDELIEAYAHLEETKTAFDNWWRSIQYVGRAADSTSRKVVRSIEDIVYKRVMTKVSPFYFDNQLISANLERRGFRSSSFKYVFEVNINDGGLKDEVRERLEALEADAERWHLDVEKDTETVETVEGVNQR